MAVDRRLGRVLFDLGRGDIVSRHLLALLCLAALATLAPSCSAAGKLPPCQAPNTRMWCRCEVAQTTEARAAAGLPVACVIPFVATKCVEGGAPGAPNAVGDGGLMEFLSGLDKLTASYAAPGGWPPYVVVDGNAYWLRCPAKTDSGYADCVTSGQPTNPWPSYPVANLDSASPITPGIKPQGGPGDPGAGGGAGEGGDCAICLADAACSGLTPAECTTMHCAAVCPWDDTSTTCQDVPAGIVSSDCAGSGEACGIGASCCSGLYCYGTDTGSECM